MQRIHRPANIKQPARAVGGVRLGYDAFPESRSGFGAVQMFAARASVRYVAAADERGAATFCKWMQDRTGFAPVKHTPRVLGWFSATPKLSPKGKHLLSGRGTSDKSGERGAI